MYKSDKWIKRHSALENFKVYARTADGALINRYDLAEIMMLHESAGLGQLDFGMVEADHGNLRKRSAPQLKALFEQIDFDRRSVPMPPCESLFFFNEKTTGACTTPIIYPYVDNSQSDLTYRGIDGKVPSYGVSSYGYDISLGNKFRVADDRRIPGKTNVLDFFTYEASPDQSHMFREFEGDAIDLLPGQFMLGHSREWVRMPRDVMAVCMQKSTLARKGCIAYVTPIEPGWRGYITLEIFNATPFVMRLYAGMGIMQLLFAQGEEPPRVSYADRSGKYQSQPAEPVMAKNQ